MALVKIYKLGRSVDLWRWLCRRCLEALKAEGWDVRAEVEPPHVLPCDGLECAAMRRAAA